MSSLRPLFPVAMAELGGRSSQVSPVLGAGWGACEVAGLPDAAEGALPRRPVKLLQALLQAPPGSSPVRAVLSAWAPAVRGGAQRPRADVRLSDGRRPAYAPSVQLPHRATVVTLHLHFRIG